MNTSKAPRSSGAEPSVRLRTGDLRPGHTRRSTVIRFIVGLVALAVAGFSGAAERAGTNKVQVTDGIVLPLRPVAEAVADAMQFLKKADGDYVPGRMDGDLAGYFTSAFVNEDGTRSERLPEPNL